MHMHMYYGIPSTYAYAMMSWFHNEPMAEHVTVEFLDWLYSPW